MADLRTWLRQFNIVYIYSHTLFYIHLRFFRFSLCLFLRIFLRLFHAVFTSFVSFSLTVCDCLCLDGSITGSTALFWHCLHLFLRFCDGLSYALFTLFLRALYAVKAVGLCLFGRFTGFMAPFWHWLYLFLRILSCLFCISLDDFLTPLLHLFKRGKKTSQGCETRTPKQIQQVIGDFEPHWQVAGLAESEINAPSTQSDACRTLLWRLTVMTGSCNNKNTEETGYVPVAC